jgi:hypothetical protein
MQVMLWALILLRNINEENIRLSSLIIFAREIDLIIFSILFYRYIEGGPYLKALLLLNHLLFLNNLLNHWLIK